MPTDPEAAVAGISGTIAALANETPKLDSEEPETVETVETVTIIKQSTLGITLHGGTNKPEGPYIYIDRVIAGWDVANVSFFSF